MAELNSKRVAPYLPFTTFLGSFDVLAQGVPPKLDRTLWRHSGLVQGQIMNTYRFLGLVDDEDRSTECLNKMARFADSRPTALKQLISDNYSDILDQHDLTKMSLKMLEDEFEKHFAVTGTTKQKAVTFLLKAAQFADMPLSSFLHAQLRNTSARKKRGSRQRNGEGEPTSATRENDKPSIVPGAISHSVKLESGGTLTVSITANPFAMPAEDRTFVFSMIDMVQNYEKQHSDIQDEET